MFKELSGDFIINWEHADGDAISADSTLFTIQGPTALLLTGERTALNFLQLLSGTATTCRSYADQVRSSGVKLLESILLPLIG